MAMFVKIHDLTTEASYIISDLRDARTATDRSAAEEAFATGDVITMGLVIAEPLRE